MSIAKDINLLELIIAEGFEPKPSSGGRHVMCCPFPNHNDSNPSFVIYPNQTWFCYSCNIGGDAIQFIRELHNFGFKKALQYLDIKFKKVKRIVPRGDMVEEVATEERGGVDVLRKYGPDFINFLLAEKLKQMVSKRLEANEKQDRENKINQ